MDIGKRRDFEKWQRRERIADRSICDVVAEMELGLIDASLGGKVFKKRIRRPGAGKSSGFRTLVAAKSGSRYVFMFGFAKNEMDNVDSPTLAKLQAAAGALLDMTAAEWILAVMSGLLIEVSCDEKTG